MRFIIDIETIPCQLAWVKDEIAENIKAPASYKKPESIEKWLDENRDKEADKKLRDTALDGAVGHVICIGLKGPDGEKSFYSESAMEEKPMLEHFFQYLEEQAARKDGGWGQPYFVGHNIRNFDLKFLWQRAKILNINTEIRLPWDGRHGNDFYDTMLAWTGAYAKSYSGAGLGRLCKLFGIEVKSGMDGSQVYDAWLEGRHKEIRDYCREDVNATETLFNRLK